MEDAIQDALTGLQVNSREACAKLLAELYQLGCPDELVDKFIEQLIASLSENPDTDRVLRHMITFLHSTRSPLSWLSLFEREPPTLGTLVRLFTVSEYIAERLIQDPEAFEILRLTEGEPVSAEVLRDELLAEARAAKDESSLMRLLRRFRHRETLRIAYGEFIHGHSASATAEQLSELADCIVSATVESTARLLRKRSEPPVQPDGSRVSFGVLALGSFGGKELSYQSPLDLVIIRDTAAESSVRSVRNADVVAGEYYNRLATKIVSVLSDETDDGIAYIVNTDLRPGGSKAPLVAQMQAALDYFDAKGRTWERQAYLKARVVAGDCVFACAFLENLEHWVYRRYLMRADITGIAALKRRIARQKTSRHTQETNAAGLDIISGPGGIQDIDHVVQFLQLLHGAEAPTVRNPSTLEALHNLADEGCITSDELGILRTNYIQLAGLVHASEMIGDTRCGQVPTTGRQLSQFVARLSHLRRSQLRHLAGGHAEGPQGVEPASDRPNLPTNTETDFVEGLKSRLAQTRKIVDHLLHSAFDDELAASPASDLVLDPRPDSDHIAAVFEPLGFRDPPAAYHHLQSLASESIPFLSTRRCRHFLAAIAPRLLESIANTPDPDATLISLTNVADSIGGKAVLWELFSSNTPTLELALRLCAASPYLTSILTSNPGMIDELLDSLMLGGLPSRDTLGEQMQELCAGADEIAPILQSFKNSMHLRVGARNILRKDPLRRIHKALSDIAEVCLEQVIQHEYHRLVRQLGVPVIEPSGPEAQESTSSTSETQTPAVPEPFQAAELVVLAVGKLGGQEPNYHSDIDLIFLFEGDGQTRSLVPDRRFKPTTNRHFFNQLCQRIVNSLTRVGSSGKLYDVDVSLRPRGASGQLVITADDLKDHFSNSSSRIGERLVLCKARPVWGSQPGQTAALASVREILASQSFDAASAAELIEHRHSLEKGASADNIKRSSGGTMDIEFAVHAIQLASVRSIEAPLPTGTVAAIEQLVQLKHLDANLGEEMITSYTFLRRVESALRLMNMSARHDIPSRPQALRQLAYLLADPQTDLDSESHRLTEQIARTRTRNREIFEQVLARFLPEHNSDAE